MQPDPSHQFVRVLVVEDDASLCDVMVQQLRHAGFDAHGVTSGEAALRWIDEHGVPNVLSTDLGLPIQSGFRLCEELRRRADTAAMPIAIVSARLDIADHALASELGADAFIEKPTGLGRYVDTMTQLAHSEGHRPAHEMLVVP